MNYRQWKKNYKKRYGYNPPISEDKRKRNKQIANEFMTVYKAMDLPREIAKMMAAAGDVLADMFDGLSKSMRAAAEYYRDMGEEGNSGKNSMQGMEERRSKAQRTGNA